MHHGPCWTVCTWWLSRWCPTGTDSGPGHQESSQSEETSAEIYITAVAAREAQKVLQFFTLICQHCYRRGVANTLWYDEAGQSPPSMRTDLAVRKSASDSLIRNMCTSRLPEMVFFRALAVLLDCSCSLKRSRYWPCCWACPPSSCLSSDGFAAPP